MFSDWFENALGVLQLGQASCQHGDSLRWGEIDYFLQIRQLNHDIIGNLREEIQDIYEKDERILDTELVVVTLMLGIGFGFAVEGTFPQNDEKCNQWCTLVDFVRNCYAVAAALSLACPFLSMLGFLECRRRLNIFMRIFNQYVYQILRTQNMEANMLATDPARMVEAAAQNAEGLTERLETWRRFRITPSRVIALKDQALRLSQALPGRFKDLRRRAGCSCRRKPVPDTPPAKVGPQERGVFHVPEPFFTVADDYHNWFDVWVRRWKEVSRALMFAGVFCNVICAGLLLSLYFSNQYPDQWTWYLYSGTIFISIVLAVMLLMGGFLRGPRSARWAAQGMPTWATAELLGGRCV